jgi:hypothetical protein
VRNLAIPCADARLNQMLLDGGWIEMDRSGGLVRRGQQKFNLPLKRRRQLAGYWTIALPVSELNSATMWPDGRIHRSRRPERKFEIFDVQNGLGH